MQQLDSLAGRPVLPVQLLRVQQQLLHSPQHPATCWPSCAQQQPMLEPAGVSQQWCTHQTQVTDIQQDGRKVSYTA